MLSLLLLQRIQKPEVLFTQAIDVEERVVLEQEKCGLPLDASCRRVKGVTGETVCCVLSEVNFKYNKGACENLAITVVLSQQSFFHESVKDNTGYGMQESGFWYVLFYISEIFENLEEMNFCRSFLHFVAERCVELECRLRHVVLPFSQTLT